MLFITLKRLQHHPWLTLLSILGVALAVGLVTSVPVFSKAVSFVMLQEELTEVSRRTGRPLFSMRVYVLPSGRYELPLDKCAVLGQHIAETLSNEVGLPVIRQSRHIETTGLAIRTRDEVTPYGPPHTFLTGDTNLAVLPGSESRITVLEGEPIEGGSPSENGELKVWMHQTMADEMGVHPGEKFEVRDLRRNISVPIVVAGIWRATDPKDPFWFSNPDLELRRKLLTREDDYKAIVEGPFKAQLGFVSWYLIMDDSRLASEKMEDYAEGLRKAHRIISKYLPNVRIDSSPLDALDNSISRERKLTVLLFVFSVPMMGFLLYFLTLISTITIRWQQRETAVMVSRGLRRGQLVTISLFETLIIVGIGVPLGILGGIRIAELMGYTKSFMSFTWREPLPVSPTAYNSPMLIAAIGATFLARLLPAFRSARTSVVSHERARARAPHKPFWQRFYLDFLLLIPVAYAYRQLTLKGTLVPQVMTEEGANTTTNATVQDPLLFLVPALFTLALSLLLVRLFPILMHIGDWLSALGRGATFYLAFRQLSRQSSQYTSALLLVITSLGLGAFMASMALSLDQWMIDRVYYAVGSDVLIKQTINPEEDTYGMGGGGSSTPITEGAWVLPVSSYLKVPGVLDAARVGMYPASVSLGERRSARGVFLGIDRLDLPRVMFWRPDFNDISLGEMMNRLAKREDAVILSERVLARGKYQVGDKVRIRVTIMDIPLETDFTIAGTYRYFPTVYEEAEHKTAVIGNLDFLFEQVGAVLLHNIWLKIDPGVEQKLMVAKVKDMGVFIGKWVDTRDLIAEEQAKVERVGIFGMLTIGFLGAATLSGVGLLVYNYASLQERLFRFTILRAVGLSLIQVISQVSIEYLVLMVYSVAGGAVIGVWASKTFIPFFQAADKNVLNPPSMIPLIAWQDIGRISGAFTVALVLAQIIVISAALRRGVFQALRMGDRE